MNHPTSAKDLLFELERDGFAYVPADAMRQLSGDLTADPDWPAFAASWNDLAEDAYLAAQGRYRRRRHAVFGIGAPDTIEREPDQAHYQSVEYNPLQGGIERWFEPIRPHIANGHILRNLLELGANVFGKLARATTAWRVEAHQFRIQARAGHPGLPTPEGMHRDGVDFVLVVLIARHNVASGTTSIHAPDGQRLGEFTLAAPMDSAWVVDERVLHGVTPVHALDPADGGWRDVLVVTFKRRAPG